MTRHSDAPLDITQLYFPDCPHWRLADERLRTIADEAGTTITRTVIDTAEAAESAGFRGSPTILIGGVDPFADPSAPVGLSCRLYPTPQGYAGAPTLDQLRHAIAVARHSSSAATPDP